MQAVPNSVISLNCYSKGDQSVSKVVAFSFSGGMRCTLSNHTFDELLAQRMHAKLPCVLARVKDIEGKEHLFEGCAADTLGSFKLLGHFKVTLDAEWKACSYIQYFTLVGTSVANQQLFHNFSLARTDTFFTLQGEMFLAGKKPDYASAKKYLDKALKEKPNNERALQLLGKLFFYGHGVPQNREKARDYFNRAIEINPENKFVLNRLAELELPVHMVAAEPEDLADQLNVLSLEESSGTESEAPAQDASDVPGADALSTTDQDSDIKDASSEAPADPVRGTEHAFVHVALPAKKQPCDCALL